MTSQNNFFRDLAEALEKDGEQQEQPTPQRPSAARLAAGLAALDDLQAHLSAGGDFPVTSFQKEALTLSRNTLRRYLDHERRAGRA
ncbi:hypothetical protein [Microbacterium sp. LWS13-1.2]